MYKQIPQADYYPAKLKKQIADHNKKVAAFAKVEADFHPNLHILFVKAIAGDIGGQAALAERSALADAAKANVIDALLVFAERPDLIEQIKAARLAEAGKRQAEAADRRKVITEQVGNVLSPSMQEQAIRQDSEYRKASELVRGLRDYEPIKRIVSPDREWEAGARLKIESFLK